MFNPTEIPSLAAVLDVKLKEVGIEVVPGRVSSQDGHFFGNFSMASEDVANMTSDELFLGFLKPMTEEIAEKIIEYADGNPICTKAIPLPDKKSKVIGFRCFQGMVPVNVYVMRLREPDRHRFIVDTIVQKVGDDV